MNARESLNMLNEAHKLVAAGQHAGALEFLDGKPDEDLERSPGLALLLGISHARLGHNDDARRWVEIALRQSRERGDRAAETRALNVSGAIALESGRVAEAAAFFAQALAEAERGGDHATVGRASNNLGIIANLRGDFGRAIGSYTMALAAFQRADFGVGIAEALHNLAITYRDQGELQKALDSADKAFDEAMGTGDVRLSALARAGRAEIRLLAGDVNVARREIEQVLEIERKIGNDLGEAQHLRVWAGCLAQLGEEDEAERVLHDVIERAAERGRPLLAAQAERDLARLLARLDRREDARALATRARDGFLALGAEAEARKLGDLLE